MRGWTTTLIETWSRLHAADNTAGRRGCGIRCSWRSHWGSSGRGGGDDARRRWKDTACASQSLISSANVCKLRSTANRIRRFADGLRCRLVVGLGLANYSRHVGRSKCRRLTRGVGVCGATEERLMRLFWSPGSSGIDCR